jgi:ribosomal protein S18 acetylase RimI-like enzyme
MLIPVGLLRADLRRMSMDNGAWKVRRAMDTDILQITTLCDQLGYPSSSEQVAERIKNIQSQDDHALFVIQHSDGSIVGWVHVYICPLLVTELEAELGGLVVDERFRGQGIGQLLMRHAELWSREKGCQALHLRSNVTRKNAHAFYHKIGYRKIKTSWMFRKELQEN